MPAEEDRKKRREHRRKHKSSHREHRSQSEKRPRPVVSLAKRFWFELVALGLLSLGVFLLVEKLEIKAIIWRTLVNWAGVVGDAGLNLWNRIVYVFQNVKQSNLVGIALILIAIVMIALSMRRRAILRHSSPPLAKECPECREDLYRMQRRLTDRLLEFFLRIRIRRYSCSKCSFRACVWKTRGESE